MSADVIAFPSPPVGPVKGFVAGDLILTCVNATLGLWCAWPVHSVDDDGCCCAVVTRHGQVIAIERVSSRAERFGFRRVDHRPLPFVMHAWRTFTDPAVAVLALAQVALDPREAEA
ncbi:hypothetical protein [Brevundimonas sp. DC300-4]|uniref:hypothetical protein n=1 Tax=Brevundimonas sp. DC300-4 TaxID=2804594 RepID=UPI003CF3AC5A